MENKNQDFCFEDIRSIVEFIADLICCHGVSTEMDGLIRELLLEQGFDLNMVRRAEAWCDRVQATGSLVEVLSLFAPQGEGFRVTSALERLSLPEKIRLSIETCRYRGIISSDLAERILESARALDTRDWNEDEVYSFIEQACQASGAQVNRTQLDLALKKKYFSQLS